MNAKWVENEWKNEKWVERTHFFQIEFERSALTFLKVRNESESTHQICEWPIVCANHLILVKNKFEFSVVESLLKTRKDFVYLTIQVSK